jgi:hypothetical protein
MNGGNAELAIDVNPAAQFLLEVVVVHVTKETNADSRADRCRLTSRVYQCEYTYHWQGTTLGIRHGRKYCDRIKQGEVCNLNQLPL